jgi:NADH-quinone oxidoreductase subunit C
MAAHVEALAALVSERVGDKAKRYASLPSEVSFEVAPADLTAVARLLRDDPALRFEQLIDVTCVDYLEHGKTEWKTQAATDSGFSRGVSRSENAAMLPEQAGEGLEEHPSDKPADMQRGRFAVVYQLLSISKNERLRLKTWCASDIDPEVDSMHPVWASADWFEREVYDLFGITFNGHPDLRRILTDYGFVGHPFRKDFPLSGNVEVRYDPKLGRVVYEPVDIEPRVLVPRVIRHDNRYDVALKDAPPAPAGAAATPAVAPPPAAPAPPAAAAK